MGYLASSAGESQKIDMGLNLSRVALNSCHWFLVRWQKDPATAAVGR